MPKVNEKEKMQKGYKEIISVNEKETRCCHGDVLPVLTRNATCQHKSNEPTARQRLQRLRPTRPHMTRVQTRKVLLAGLTGV